MQIYIYFHILPQKKLHLTNWKKAKSKNKTMELWPYSAFSTISKHCVKSFIKKLCANATQPIMLIASLLLLKWARVFSLHQNCGSNWFLFQKKKQHFKSISVNCVRFNLILLVVLYINCLHWSPPLVFVCSENIWKQGMYSIFQVEFRSQIHSLKALII